MNQMPSTPNSRKPWRRTALAVMLMAGTALGGFAVGQSGFAATDASGNAVPGTPVNPPGGGMTGHSLPDFSDLVTQVKPAVVSITTRMQAGQGSDEDQAQMPLPFRQFPFGGMGPQMGPQARAVEARGSGFIVDADGTIVTNNHVVKDAKTVSVTLDDGTKLPAKVVGRNSRTDIAVLEDRCPPKASLHPAWQFREREAGRMGVGDGQPIRPGRFGDRRHRFGQRPRHRRRPV